MNPPDGFRPMTGLSPFNALVGPLYERREGSALSVGLRIEAKHGNSRGICHGGLLATVADLEVQRVGARLAFANCYLVADGGRRIVRASAIFARAETSE